MDLDDRVISLKICSQKSIYPISQFLQIFFPLLIISLSLSFSLYLMYMHKNSRIICTYFLYVLHIFIYFFLFRARLSILMLTFAQFAIDHLKIVYLSLTHITTTAIALIWYNNDNIFVSLLTFVVVAVIMFCTRFVFFIWHAENQQANQNKTKSQRNEIKNKALENLSILSGCLCMSNFFLSSFCYARHR